MIELLILGIVGIAGTTLAGYLGMVHGYSLGYHAQTAHRPDLRRPGTLSPQLAAAERIIRDVKDARKREENFRPPIAGPGEG